MLNFIIKLFELVISLIMAGCQFIGSAILFVVLFLIFILVGFVTTVFLLEYLKTPYSVFNKSNEIIVGNGRNYEVKNESRN